MDNGMRERILDEGARLFLQYGFKRTIMEDIASAVGMAKGSLYLHFSSKEEIFRAIGDRQIERALERMRRVGGQTLPADCKLREMMLDVLLFIWDFCHQAPHAPDLWAETLAVTEHPAERGQLAGRAILAEVIAEGQADGLFAADMDPVYAAETVQWAMRGFQPPYAFVHRREQLEQGVKRVMELLMQGMKAAPVPSAIREGTR